ncbi:MULTISPECIES: hypothetical protein [Roseomonadaceae]|uniref:Uncharacterized protein n=1 Tax=Falsiroseomonas oleicola TaxID=2801474 RepID=A0ABS6H4J5_9PROT|nr:hypothetical protein [Roseomonas oleicola]MBU8543600.1 hypothetical protein [Roseomonas oleicola]
MDPGLRWMLVIGVVAPALWIALASADTLVPRLPMQELGIGLAAAIWVLESARYLRLQWRDLPLRPGFPGRKMPTDAIDMRLMAVPAATFLGALLMLGHLLLG